MGRSGEVVLEFADGEYPFALRIGQLIELQDKCNAGPWYVQWALQASVLGGLAGSEPPREMSAAYVTEPIRLGLIGGGMEPVQALRLVRDYVGPGHLTRNIQLAFAVLVAALQGAPEDEPEKPAGGGKTGARRSPAAKSALRKSSATAPQSA